ETKEQQSLHRFLQFGIYFSLALDILLFIYAPRLMDNAVTQHYGLTRFLERMARIVIYHHPLNSKLFTLILICLVSIGTLSRKKKDLNPKNAIAYPLAAGLLIFIGSLWFYGKPGQDIFSLTTWYDIGYISCTFFGAVLIHIAMDNVSKII